LNDEFKDYPESALYMIGTVDEAVAKAKATKAKPEEAKPAAKKPEPPASKPGAA
jgi:F-type H+/Na+-transporting ATPase subunit beta